MKQNAAYRTQLNPKFQEQLLFFMPLTCLYSIICPEFFLPAVALARFMHQAN